MNISSITPGGPQALETPAQRREVFEQFEAIFTREMVKQMKGTLGKDSLFGDGPGAGIYEGMFEDIFADLLAKEGSLGLADQLERLDARGR